MELIVTNTLLAAVPAEGGEAHGSPYNIFWYVGLVMAIILVFTAIARRGFTSRVFIGWPALLAEHVYEFIRTLVNGIIGPRGERYVPFLLALWLFIFVSNFIGLFLEHTPTADWSLNLSLAVLTIFYVQYEGIREHGFFGWLKHFSGPKMAGIMIVISVFLFFIEFVSEWMKMFSLSIRLFGNIEGGHIVKTSLDTVVPFLPLGGLLLPIKLLTVVLQAYIFVMLTAVYIALITSHHEEEHPKHAHEEGAPAAAH